MIEIITKGNFSLCRGEIGVDDFSPYLESLPKIDFVYCGLPKPEYYRYWYSTMKTKPQMNYEDYLLVVGDILVQLDAAEYHLEVNDGNKDLVLKIFGNMDLNFKSMPILYSAPIDATSERYARKRKPDEMLVISKKTLQLPTSAKYSHEYLDQVLARPQKLTCFDPAMGKGLLVKFCLKYGHSAHGIDMNWNRLKVALEMIETSISSDKPI